MRLILTLLGVAGAAWIALSIYVYVMQERIVFLPDLPGRAIELTPDVFGFDYSDVYLETSDGVRLHGWYVNAENATGTVLFLHGNAGNISHRIDSIENFNSLGLDVFIIDYRGYGQSEGAVSEQGAYLDAAAAYSLGGAIAAQLAATNKAGALIVESSFTSAADMATTLYPFLPARLLLRLKFPVVDHVSSANVPVLIVHGRDDEIIPFAMGEQLYAAAPEPKMFLPIDGDHNTAFVFDRERYVAGLRQFLVEQRKIDK